jgi:DNA-binding NarL/FixJ family response regulator
MPIFRSLRLSSQSGTVGARKCANNPDVQRCGAYFNWGAGIVENEQSVRLGPREKEIVELLLQGCDNAEIAKQLKMARRTVKAHFNRLFLRFGINDGIKRVKLATLLYRRQSCSHTKDTETASPASESTVLSN